MRRAGTSKMGAVVVRDERLELGRQVDCFLCSSSAAIFLCVFLFQAMEATRQLSVAHACVHKRCGSISAQLGVMRNAHDHDPRAHGCAGSVVSLAAPRPSLNDGQVFGVSHVGDRRLC